MLLSDVQPNLLRVGVVEGLGVLGVVSHGLVGGAGVAVVVVAILHGRAAEHNGGLSLHAGILRVAAVALTAATAQEQARQNHLELLLEVVVHPGVQEGVVDGGAHGDDVGDEEDEGEVVPVLHRGVVLTQQQDDVERHPAAHEDDHHGDQHLVGALLAPDLLLLALAGPGAAANLHLHTDTGSHMHVPTNTTALKHSSTHTRVARERKGAHSHALMHTLKHAHSH